MKKFAEIIILQIALLLGSQTAFANSEKFNERWGDRLSYAMPLFAAGYSTIREDWDGDLQFAKTFGASMGTTYALKYAFPDERPNGKPNTFPSGHATSAFASAAYLNDRYGIAFGIPSYFLASFVSYSRIDTHNHDWDDVIAGAAIGIGFSYLFTKPYENKNLKIGLTASSLKNPEFYLRYNF